MRRLTIPFILPWLAFIIPVNIYENGNWITAGIQWALIRFQLNMYGMSLISPGNEIYYMTKGLLQIKTLISTLVWFTGIACLLICIIFLLRDFQRQVSNPYKIPGLLIILSGCAFLISDMVQYGLFLNSNLNLCIPIGIPFLMILGSWEYRYAADSISVPNQDLLPPVIDNTSFIGKKIEGYLQSEILQALSVLIIVSVFAKIIVFTLSSFSPYMMSQADIQIYYAYANATVTAGQIPYHNFIVEYPQFFFIPVFIAIIPTFLIPGYGTFFASFLVLSCLLDIVTLVCVYLIARKIIGEDRAFLCGLLYATAFSAIFFVSMTYDIFPAFLMMLSLLLFLYGRETGAYISAAAGALAKWFPVVCFPYYLVYSFKNRQDLRPALWGIGLSAILGGLVLVPLLIINPARVLATYTVHLGRTPDPHGMIYYLDVISNALIHLQPFSKLSMLLLVIGECAFIVWYYKSLNGKPVTLCMALLIAIFYFFLVNTIGTPTFIIWFTPLLALLFINTTTEIVGFYLIQLAIYAENPLLLGTVWGPGMTYDIVGNSGPSLIFLFYTGKFAILVFVMVYMIWRLNREGKSGQEEKNGESPS